MSEVDDQSKNQSNFNIKLTIKKSGIEINTEGEIQHIIQNISSISSLIYMLIEELDTDEYEREISEDTFEPETGTTSEIPAISPGSGIQDNVEKLFNTTWGKTPRSVSDTLKALEVNAIYTEYAQTSNALRRLVQQGVLRRIKREGRWMYYSIPGRE
jgi:hypothetical protein